MKSLLIWSSIMNEYYTNINANQKLNERCSDSAMLPAGTVFADMRMQHMMKSNFTRSISAALSLKATLHQQKYSNKKATMFC